jgi:hypothetical protein
MKKNKMQSKLRIILEDCFNGETPCGIDGLEMAIKEWTLKSVKLCPSNLCQKGKALSKDGSSSVESCSVCNGKGWYVSL